MSATLRAGASGSIALRGDGAPEFFSGFSTFPISPRLHDEAREWAAPAGAARHQLVADEVKGGRLVFAIRHDAKLCPLCIAETPLCMAAEEAQRLAHRLPDLVASSIAAIQRAIPRGSHPSVWSKEQRETAVSLRSEIDAIRSGLASATTPQDVLAILPDVTLYNAERFVRDQSLSRAASISELLTLADTVHEAAFYIKKLVKNDEEGAAKVACAALAASGDSEAMAALKGGNGPEYARQYARRRNDEGNTDDWGFVSATPLESALGCLEAVALNRDAEEQCRRNRAALEGLRAILDSTL